MKPMLTLIMFVLMGSCSFSQITDTVTMKIENGAEDQVMKVTVAPWKYDSIRSLYGVYMRIDEGCKMFITISHDGTALNVHYHTKNCIENSEFDFFNPTIENGMLQLEKKTYEPVIVSYIKEGKQTVLYGLLDESYYFFAKE